MFLSDVPRTSLQVIGTWIAAHSLDEVLTVMKTARVPAGPILSTGDIFAEEQYQQRGMFQQARPPSGEARRCHVVRIRRRSGDRLMP